MSRSARPRRPYCPYINASVLKKRAQAMKTYYVRRSGCISITTPLVPLRLRCCIRMNAGCTIFTNAQFELTVISFPLVLSTDRAILGRRDEAFLPGISALTKRGGWRNAVPKVRRGRKGCVAVQGMG